MIEAWREDRALDGVDVADATREIDEYLKEAPDGKEPRRSQLKDANKRAEIRVDLRAHRKALRAR